MNIGCRENLPKGSVWRVAVAAGVLATICGCGGKPFNVRPHPSLPERAYNTKIESGGLTIQADALTDEDLLYEIFDANLVLAGVLPVRIKLINGRDEEFRIKKARFEVKSEGGAVFKPIEPKRAYRQLVSYYGITLYRKDAYRESQQDFASHALDTVKTLSIGEVREGIIFFAAPGEISAIGNLTLVASRLNAKRSKDSIELKL
jgi:hypothetical protein